MSSTLANQTYDLPTTSGPTEPPPTSYVVKNQSPLDIRNFSLGPPIRGLWNDPYVSDYKVEIIGRTGTTSDTEQVIGYIEAQVVRMEQAEHDGEDLEDLCSNNLGLQYMHEAILQYDYQLFRPIRRRFTNSNKPGDILYIDSVRLEESYRGYGIGLLALDLHIKDFLSSLEPGFGTMVLSASPLRTDMGPGFDQSDQDLAVKKLTDYYSLLGFSVWARHVGVHDALMGCWGGKERVDIRELLPHLFR